MKKIERKHLPTPEELDSDNQADGAFMQTAHLKGLPIPTEKTRKLSKTLLSIQVPKVEKPTRMYFPQEQVLRHCLKMHLPDRKESAQERKVDSIASMLAGSSKTPSRVQKEMEQVSAYYAGHSAEELMNTAKRCAEPELASMRTINPWNLKPCQGLCATKQDIDSAQVRIEKKGEELSCFSRSGHYNYDGNPLDALNEFSLHRDLYAIKEKTDAALNSFRREPNSISKENLQKFTEERLAEMDFTRQLQKKYQEERGK